MFKQIFLLVIIIFCLVTCKQAPKNPINKNQIHKTELAEITKFKILGTWGIFGMNAALCNACPAILFNDNQTGVFKGADSSFLGKFKWSISDSTLTIYGTDVKGYTPIPENSYYFKLTTIKGDEELILTDLKDTSNYILRRYE